MLLFIKLIMMTVGIYSIVTARIPAFHYRDDKYHVDGQSAQIFGILLMIPLPTAFIGGIILRHILGHEIENLIFSFELFSIIVFALFAIAFIRVVSEKTKPSLGLEETIANHTYGALMYAIFSAAGFSSIICCPLAFYYANKAENLIDNYGIGEKHRSLAEKARAFALVMTVMWSTTLICFVFYYFEIMQ